MTRKAESPTSAAPAVSIEEEIRRGEALASARRRPGISGVFEEGHQPPEGVYLSPAHYAREPSGWEASQGIKPERKIPPVKFGES